jgi:hypothetical protein
MLSDDGDNHTIFAAASISPDKIVKVPAVDKLDVAGTDLNGLVFAVSARAYSHAAASLSPRTPDRGPANWYAYAYLGGEILARHWPHLPKAVSLNDIGFVDGGQFDVTVAGVTNAGDAWDFTQWGESLGIGSVYGPFPILGGAGVDGGSPSDAAPADR